MKKSKRLLPVQKLNKMREDDAAKMVGFARQEVIKQEEQLQGLIQYREEYQASITVGSSPTGQQLQDFHSFLISLNIAIDQQESKLLEVRGQLEDTINQWEKAHGKLKVMSKLITRYEAEEDVCENRNEQKIIDDLPKRDKAGGQQFKL
ncbi:MAG: flagellar export protein FliJ [Pseudomonadales bacterium]|nr:flagellar export protein FliJ [Pseudomonadales bacterium]